MMDYLPAARVIAGASVLAMGLAIVPQAMAAQAARQNFNIPAGDAATSLRLFARQSGRQILFPYDAVAGRRTSAVIGSFVAADVLARLAAEAGLTVAASDASTTTLVASRPQRTIADPVQEYAPENDIIVTATKRPENIRNVPIAITALRQEDIQRRGPTNTEDAMRFVPGVNVSSNGANSVNYTIRGVNTSSATSNVQSTIALYVDDLSMLDPFFPRVTTNLRLFDVERVEVLRGPQGTLFGSGALGGAIRVITNKPDAARFAAATELTLASTDGGEATYQANVMVNVPLVEDLLAVRAVAYYDQIGGYVDNTRTGQNDTNRVTSKGGRVQLRFTPGDRLSFTGTALFQKDDPEDSGYTTYAGDSYTFNSFGPTRFPQDLQIYSLNAEYDANFATLTSITTYADKDEFSLVDFTRLSTLLTGLSSVAPISNSGPSKTFQQEVRLASSGGGRFDWLIGGIYYLNRRTIAEQVEVAGAGAKFGPLGFPSDFVIDTRFQRRTEEAAIFGEASYAVTDRLKVTLGARAFRNTIKVVETIGGYLNRANIGVRERDFEEEAVTPKFALSYRASGAVTFYAQAAKGYRIGQPNVAAIAIDSVSGEIIPPGYEADSLWNYEAGAKAAFLDGRVTINAAAYYIDWKDIQLPARTSGLGLNYIGNAGDATIKGFEVDLRAAPSDYLDIGGSVSVIDGRLEDVRNNAAARVGDRLPASAELTSSGFVQLHGDIADRPAFVRVDARFVGEQFATLMNRTSLTYGDFADLGVRAGVTFGAIELTGFVTNLTNGSNRESALTTLGVPVAIRQRPRTIGLTLRAGL